MHPTHMTSSQRSAILFTLTLNPELEPYVSPAISFSLTLNPEPKPQTLTSAVDLVLTQRDTCNLFYPNPTPQISTLRGTHKIFQPNCKP